MERAMRILWRSWSSAATLLVGVVAMVALAALLALIVPAVSGAAAARPPVSPAALASALSSARATTGIPGLQAAVVVDGQLAWTGAAGLAVDRAGLNALTGRRAVARSVRATTATRWSIASLSKIYTATMVLKLVQEGRIGLDDPVARWVTPAPPAGAVVTVRELLNHTSGYPDVETYGTLADQLDLFTAYDPHRAYDLPQILTAMRAPQFPPGTRYEYSNVNYLLLGAILLRADGGTLDTQLRGIIANPLRLTATSYADQPGLARRMAHGYETDDGRRYDHWSGSTTVPTDVVGPVWADGGVVTTASDAALFGNALARGQILDATTLATMTTPSVVSGTEQYGMASYVYRTGGRTWNGHDGNYAGYQTVLFTDAAAGLTIAVFANDDSDGVWDVFSALANTLRP
jgi:D-alanyl-D-alanine carboxypeptidase